MNIKIERFKKRCAMSIGGVCITSLAVSMLNLSGFGMDPFQVISHGIANVTSSFLNFGTTYTILCAILFIIDFILDKHYIGIATFFNMFCAGYIIQFFCKIFDTLFPDPNLLVRILFLIGGLVVLCFGTAIYFTSDLGVSPYDAIIKILADRKVFSFVVSFIVCHSICCIVGGVTGCMPGIGTILTAFFMGPLVDFFNIHVAIPFLWGKEAAAAYQAEKKQQKKKKVKTKEI